MKCVRLLGLFGLGVVMSWCAPKTTSAAALIVGTYYEEDSFVSCGASNRCSLEFTATPATGPLVLITKVSCNIGTPSGIGTTHLGFTKRDTSGGTDLRFETLLLPQPFTTATGGRNYSSVTPSDFLFGNARIPTVIAFFDTTPTNSLPGMACKISGRLQQ